jgi:hypothetical protein
VALQSRPDWTRVPAFAREAGCGANVPPRHRPGGGAGAAPSLDAKFQVLPRAVIVPRPCRGSFFFVRIERASRRLMLRRSRITPPQRACLAPGMRQRTHYGGDARIFSTACSPWRDASCPLLTDLVRSVYGPVGRDVASGHATDITTSLATHSQSSRRSSECRWRAGGFLIGAPALRSGNTHAAGCRRRPDTA